MSSRLEEIKNIIALAPADPFPRYGLAMEYKNLGRHDEAQQAFADLMGSHPDYVPQYLLHGNLLLELRRRDEARTVFQKGIEAAKKARNQHALGELRAALSGIDDLED